MRKTQPQRKMGKSHVHSIQRENSTGQHIQENMSPSHVIVNAN